MNNTIFKKLVSEAILETESLLAGTLKENEFLEEVHEILVLCKNDNYKVATNSLEKFRLLGLAAVKQFDSFDYVPEAEKFVSLTSNISKAFEANEDNITS